MDFLLELLFDIILEGSIAVASEKKVPMPIRIIAAFICWIIFFGLGGLFLFMGYDAHIENDIVSAIFLYVIGGAMVGGGIYIVIKMFQKKKETKFEKENLFYEED